jgi:hypothetical protein
MKLTLLPTEVKTIEAEVRSLQMTVDTTNQVGETPYVVYPNLYRAGEDYEEDGTWTVKLPGSDGSDLELRFEDRTYLAALTRTLMDRLGIKEDRSNIPHRCEVQGTKVMSVRQKVMTLALDLLSDMINAWNDGDEEDRATIVAFMNGQLKSWIMDTEQPPFDLNVDRIGYRDHETKPFDDARLVEDVYDDVRYASEVRLLYRPTDTTDGGNPC